MTMPTRGSPGTCPTRICTGGTGERAADASSALRITAATASSISTSSPTTVPLGEAATSISASASPDSWRASSIAARTASAGANGPGESGSGRTRERNASTALSIRSELVVMCSSADWSASFRRPRSTRWAYPWTVVRLLASSCAKPLASRATSSALPRSPLPAPISDDVSTDGAGAGAAAEPALSTATAPPRPVRGVQRTTDTVTRTGAPSVPASIPNGGRASPACTRANASARAGQADSEARKGCPVPGPTMDSQSRAAPEQRRMMPASSVATSPIGNASRTAASSVSPPGIPPGGAGTPAAGRPATPGPAAGLAASAALIVAAAKASSERRSLPAVAV